MDQARQSRKPRLVRSARCQFCVIESVTELWASWCPLADPTLRRGGGRTERSPRQARVNRRGRRHQGRKEAVRLIWEPPNVRKRDRIF